MEESLGMRLYIYIPKDLVHIIVLVLEFVGKQHNHAGFVYALNNWC